MIFSKSNEAFWGCRARSVDHFGTKLLK
ncbi:unnamed protein product, partial [Rotaria magnacalcarata]